jgi:hypothetical protein
MLKIMIKGISDSGCEIQNIENNWLIKRPTTIAKAILIPTEKRRISHIANSSFNFSNLTTSNPGMKVK